MSNDEPKPWTKVGVRSEKDFKVLTARTFDVLDPRNGAPWIRTVLEAPDWVNTLAVTEDDQVVLVRQFRFGTWSNTLEIPGGMIDGREDPLIAAARELEEETGFRPARIRSLGWSHPNPALFTNRLHSFIAEGCAKVHAGHLDAAEDIQVVLEPRSRVPELVRSGQVTHSLVLAALYFDAIKG